MPSRLKRKAAKILPSLIILIILISLIPLSTLFIVPRLIDRSVVSPLSIGGFKSKNIENELMKKNIPFDKVLVASDSSYLVYLKNNGWVLISKQKNIESQVSSLQLILERLTIEGKKFKKLDLRYDKPIIEF